MDEQYLGKTSAGLIQGRTGALGPTNAVESALDISDVGHALVAADQTAHEVLHRVQKLHDRLGPILRPMPPSGETRGHAAVTPALAPLAEGIRGVTDTQVKTLALLGAIHEALAL